jgi:iron complex outermembrane receptor protein
MKSLLTPALWVATVLASAQAFAQAADATTPDASSQAPVALPTINVEASADASAQGLAKPYAGGEVARGGRVGFLGTRDMMETPFASLNFTNALIQDQQARSVADVLLNDPGVRNARGFGNFQELYVVRGFPLYSDDLAYNGLYGLLPRQYIASELLERVEVFRGANAFLNGAAPGASGLGGAINLLPKRATNEPLSEVTLGTETGGQFYAAGDVARRFGPGQSFGVRINVAHRDGDTSVDAEHRRLDIAAIGLDWRSRSVRLSADVGYQDHQLDAPRPSVTPVDGIAAAPSAKGNYAQPWTQSNERETFGTLRGELDFGTTGTAWIAGGARRGNESNVLANPSAMADGTTTAYRFDNARDDTVWTGEIGVRGSLATGPVSHALSAIATRYSLDSRNAYAFSDFAGFANDLYHPFPVAEPPADFFTGGNLASPLTTQKTTTSSVALADVLGFLDDTLQVTLGVRQQRIQDRTFDYNTGAQTSSYDESRPTPATGILYRVTPRVSVYANYMEGLVRGDVAPLVTPAGEPVTNGGEAFAPYRTRQEEIGAKYDGGNLAVQMAIYRITKPVGALQSNDNGTATFVVSDAERHDGLELLVFGQPVDGLRLIGGVNLIDARMTETDKKAVGVPRVQANVGVDWDIPGVAGLAVDARAIYTADQYASADNTLQIPSWTRLDLGVRYAWIVGDRTVMLRGRVDNVTNRNYWASVGGYPGANYMVLGGPRTFVVSASVDF